MCRLLPLITQSWIDHGGRGFLGIAVSFAASSLRKRARKRTPLSFVQVKSNIFDLLADLAWSFSDMQLDSLFNRFERSKVCAADVLPKFVW